LEGKIRGGFALPAETVPRGSIAILSINGGRVEGDSATLLCAGGLADATGWCLERVFLAAPLV